jgi:hypothetical protein
MHAMLDTREKHVSGVSVPRTEDGKQAKRKTEGEEQGDENIML